MVFFKFCLQLSDVDFLLMNFFFQNLYLVGLRLNDFILCLASSESGSRHSFCDTTVFGEILFGVFQPFCHHPVDLTAEGDGEVGEFLIGEFGEEGSVVLLVVVGAAELQQLGVAGVCLHPIVEDDGR